MSTIIIGTGPRNFAITKITICLIIRQINFFSLEPSLRDLRSQMLSVQYDDQFMIYRFQFIPFDDCIISSCANPLIKSIYLIMPRPYKIKNCYAGENNCLIELCCAPMRVLFSIEFEVLVFVIVLGYHIEYKRQARGITH